MNSIEFLQKFGLVAFLSPVDEQVYIIDPSKDGVDSIWDVRSKGEFAHSQLEVPDYMYFSEKDFLLTDELPNHFGVPANLLVNLSNSPFFEWSKILLESGQEEAGQALKEFCDYYGRKITPLKPDEVEKLRDESYNDIVVQHIEQEKKRIARMLGTDEDLIDFNSGL